VKDKQPNNKLMKTKLKQPAESKPHIFDPTPRGLLSVLLVLLAASVAPAVLGGEPNGADKDKDKKDSGVVKSLNGLTGNVALTAGSNITIVPFSNELRISAASAGSTSDANAWHRSGNVLSPEDFLGSVNNAAVEIRVGGVRALRLEPTTDAPNVISGFEINQVFAGVTGATIGGGGGDIQFVRNETILSGYQSVAANFGTVGGGAGNVIAAGCDLSTVSGGGGNVILSNSPYSTIAGGFLGLIEGDALFSTIGGGDFNTVETNADSSTISGGVANLIQASSQVSTIGGGLGNGIGTNSQMCVIGGGGNNRIANFSGYSTIAGGYFNLIDQGAGTSSIGGGNLNQVGAGAGVCTIAGGANNTIGTNSSVSTICGGTANSISNNSTYALICGGAMNGIYPNNYGSIIVGGNINQILDGAQQSVIGGGGSNVIETNAADSTIGGGIQNTIQHDAYQSTISGGIDNVIGNGAYRSTIGGGFQNSISAGATYATVPGGAGNVAGAYSFAAGQQAEAVQSGCFVWGDASAGAVASTAPNQFVARAAGGVTFYTSPNLSTGVQVPLGGGSWSSVSDRNLKENLQPVDGRDVLRRVAALPIQTWNLKTQDPAIRHIGPMAQDFRAAFPVGEDDKHISTVDADGVALAAIQGLNELLQEKDARIEALQQDLAELKAQVKQLAPNSQTEIRQSNR
jgi:hypothetical protein